MPESPRQRTSQRRKRPLQPPVDPPPASPATEPDVHVPALPSSGVLCPIVGIGASAGGLEAFTHLLQQLPAETGLAFVLVQHLDPTQKSLLTELLSRVTKVRVQQVQAGMRVEPNRIYVMPPNVNMTIASRVLQLAPRAETYGLLHMPIDHFFRSLARDQESRAIGVILSGTGSDGALGLAEIKEQGGITFVQDERTAQFAGMPHSAIGHGGIDFILPPEGIAQELVRVAQHPYVISPPWVREEEPLPPPTDRDELAQILRLLHHATSLDFTQYKHNTIQRRITRRMTLCKLERYAEYAQYLQQHRDELDALYHDLLIKVTGFFRDPDTFEVLKREVFPSLMHECPPNRPIRIWVPGCASGEEVYSIAICLLEFLGERTFNPPVQVFATDVDEMALAKARAGRYIENIALDVSPERLRRFFEKVDHHYQITRMVREICTFARHNLGKDPPFSKLDLISCRNVLIYFDPALQKRVLSLFHSALNPNGFLTLGSSESIGLFADLFTEVDKKHKIYAKRATAQRPPLDFTPREHLTANSVTATPGQPTEEAVWKDMDVSREADRVILNQYAPAGVVINDQMDILQFRGDTSHYLRPAPGRASFNLLRMAREGLLVDLRAAVTQAKNTGDPVTREGARVQYEGKLLDITLRVIPLTLPPPPAFRFVVLFEEAPSPAVRPVPRGARRRTAATGEDERQRNSQLEQELEATKQYLQSIIEQHEAANEELQSANEEVLSSNEELQSTNEELETAKEELQSTNEELGTVNEEIRHRNLELSQLNDDLNNLFGSANLPIIMLGNDLRIRRFTPIAEKVLSVIATDVGRPIGHLQLNIRIPDLESLIREAIDTVSPKEREVQDREGHWYSMRIRPYMTAEHKIDGAVLLLIDIDSLKDIDRLTRLLEEVKTAQNYAEGIVQSAPAPLLILNGQLRVLTANPAFYRLFQVSKEETAHQFIYSLGTGQWDIPTLRTLLENILPKNAQVDHFEVTYNFPGIGPKSMLLNARRIALEGDGTESILLAIEDITELKRAAEQLQASLSEKETLLKEIHHRVKNNLQIISSLLSLQSDKIQDQGVLRLFAESQRRVRAMALVHERLYASTNLSSIDLGDYIQDLAGQLFRAYTASGNISLNLQADELFVGIDTAIPCGLILSELISNALQHAFPAGQTGEITITLRAESEGQVLLVVQDNGIGIPRDMDVAHADSLGLSLVHGLVNQIEGSLQLDCSSGTAISLRFSAPLLQRT